MAERPSIPAELRRRVLVEAGHRCAIHTCKYTDVDVHHITPWERCREHAYENLIALCPNCHRRADAGDIDRKALRMYKARLVSGVTSTESPADVGEVNDLPGAWRTVQITERRSDAPSYDVEIEIPAFAAADLAELNEMERGWALECLQGYRRTVVSPFDYPSPDDEARLIDSAGYLSGSFTVMHFTETSLSFRYAMSSYHFGALHALSSFRTITALRKPLVVLRFDDLFDQSSDYLARVSSFAIDALLHSNSEFDPDWVREGAGATTGAFDLFNVSDDGLVITFLEYQVASYAAGPQYVTVPWARIRDVMNSRLVL